MTIFGKINLLMINILKKNTYLFSVFAVLAIFIFTALPAQAAPKKGFEAELLNTKLLYPMTPGENKMISFAFKNIGTTTWKNTGRGFISIYTQNPKYRVSDFKTDSWFDYTQAAILKEKSVAPGQVGHIELTLKAPSIERLYEESFQLAAENVTWVPGGSFVLKLDVKEKGEEKTKRSEREVVDIADKATEGLSAMVLLRSAKQVVAKAGEEVSFKVGIKNTGTVVWNSREIRSSDIVIASINTKNDSWVSPNRVVVKTAGTVFPGTLDFIDFKFNAPLSKGNHTVRYYLAVNDTIVPDFEIDIPVEVTTGSPEIIDNPLAIPEIATQAEVMISEPIVRIGIFIVDEETSWQVEVSCNSDWNLMAGNGALLAQEKANEVVTAFYKKQRYYFNRGRGLEETEQYLRFVPVSKDAICTVQNFDRRKTRRAGFADNQFRDVLELRYNPTKDRTWIINELPIEEYLYGLAETSNVSHHEFKKALLTIARTYALYHFERATKHKEEFFHMNAYADDQVYKGYEYEIRNSNIKLAAQDTEGIVVTYEGRTALTPYFSRSNGRTKAWSEVWGGDVAWIKSVPTPCDAKRGYTLWGHGVGLSATEALCMANDGSSWDAILKYFYQGVGLTNRWRKE